jgi:DNA-binding transcriptional ArsR family regulator
VETYRIGGTGAVLDALGDPTRRAIFERLGRGPRAVGQLAGELPVSRPAVSQHLKVLKSAGLVVDEPVGTRRMYRLDPAALESLQQYFARFWTQALSSFKDAVEQQEER